MVRDHKWQQFENYLVEEFKAVDPNATHTKGSRYGDLKVEGLHIEAKDYNTKSVFKEEWMIKCIEEVPLHSDKIPLLITRNKEDKIRVHMNFNDFLTLYKELHALRNGE